MALARRGATMLRAKRAIEEALESGDAVVSLPMVEDADRLASDLEAAGIAVVIRSAIDRDLKAHFAARVKDLRARLRLSQDEFARDYSLNKKTVQGWELGKKVPDHGNRLLIRMIETDPAAVRRLINSG